MGDLEAGIARGHRRPAAGDYRVGHVHNLHVDRHDSVRGHGAGCYRHRRSGPSGGLPQRLYADQSHRRRVIADFGSDYRDLGAVLKGRGVDRPRPGPQAQRRTSKYHGTPAGADYSAEAASHLLARLGALLLLPHRPAHRAA